MLTLKQRRFVDEYMIDANGAAAAIRAGYSDKYPDRQAHLLLKNPEIAAAIDAAKERRSVEVGADSRYVLRSLVEQAEADLKDLFDPKTNDLRPIEEWPPIWRTGLVQSVQIDALYEGHGKDRIQVGHTKKVRLADRIRILELIGKHVKVNAFQENIQHKGIDGLGARIDRAFKRLQNERGSILDLRALTNNAPQPDEQRQASDDKGDADLRAATEAAERYLEAEKSGSPPAEKAKPANVPPKADKNAAAMIAARPQAVSYSPILPTAAWPEEAGTAITDYDPLSD